jgi:transcriptional regulator with XRE-family HTH domain
MSLYERVAAKPGGGRALAAARLRRSVLVILHRAFSASGLDSQAELAKRLNVRRSAVNQIFRGDGNVQISTLAEYLYEMNFEVNITLVRAGELRTAALENRSPIPAVAIGSSTTSTNFDYYGTRDIGMYGYGYQQPLVLLNVGYGYQQSLVLVNAGFSAAQGIIVGLTSSEVRVSAPAWQAFKTINLSDELTSSGAAS